MTKKANAYKPKQTKTVPVRCLCGKEHLVTLPEDCQVITVHYSMTDLPLLDNEIPFTDENGKERCSKCGKRGICQYEEGVGTGEYRHVFENLISMCAGGNGFLKIPGAVGLGLYLSTVLPNLLWYATFRTMRKDWFIVDGVLTGTLLVFLNSFLYALRKDGGKLALYMDDRKLKRLKFAFNFIYSKNWFLIVLLLTMAFSVLHGRLQAKELHDVRYYTGAFIWLGWIIITPFVLQVVGGYLGVLYTLALGKGLLVGGAAEIKNCKKIFLEAGASLLSFILFMFVLHRTYSFFSDFAQGSVKVMLTQASLMNFFVVPAKLILGSIITFNYFSRRLIGKATIRLRWKKIWDFITRGDQALKFLVYLTTVLAFIIAAASNGPALSEKLQLLLLK